MRRCRERSYALPPPSRGRKEVGLSLPFLVLRDGLRPPQDEELANSKNYNALILRSGKAASRRFEPKAHRRCADANGAGKASGDQPLTTTMLALTTKKPSPRFHKWAGLLVSMSGVAYPPTPAAESFSFNSGTILKRSPTKP